MRCFLLLQTLAGNAGAFGANVRYREHLIGVISSNKDSHTLLICPRVHSYILPLSLSTNTREYCTREMAVRSQRR